MSTFIRFITSQYIIIIIVGVVISVEVVVVAVVIDAVKNIIRCPIIVHVNGSVFEGVIRLVAVIDVSFVWTIAMITYRTNAIAVTVTFHHLSHSPFEAGGNNYQLDIANCVTDRCVTRKSVFGNIIIFTETTFIVIQRTRTNVVIIDHFITFGDRIIIVETPTNFCCQCHQ